MPRKPRDESVEVLYLEVPARLKRWVEAQARANRRSTTAEAIRVLETSLDPAHQPPAPGKAGKP